LLHLARLLELLGLLLGLLILLCLLGLLLELLGLLLHLLGLLILLTGLLGLLLHPLAALLGRLELARGAARRHLVGLLRLAKRRLQLTGDLLRCHAGRALLTGLTWLLLWQTDLLVDLALLLFALLLVLRRLLDELPGLRVARLEFGLDGLVLAERLAVSRVGGSLVGSAALLTGEALIDASLLALLLTDILVSLVTHSMTSWTCPFRCCPCPAIPELPDDTASLAHAKSRDPRQGLHRLGTSRADPVRSVGRGL
jgi:hypothetical protein